MRIDTSFLEDSAAVFESSGDLGNASASEMKKEKTPTARRSQQWRNARFIILW
jgi:hypothetical protein